LIEAQRNRPDDMDMNDIYGDAVAVVIAGRLVHQPLSF
jgi:hypothetical protein